MAANKSAKNKFEFTPEEADRLVRMGWEDRTAFELIKEQFGLSENQFVHFMRSQLSVDAFKRWRRRVHNQGRIKHEKKSGVTSLRFKCTRQSTDGITKGWK